MNKYYSEIFENMNRLSPGSRDSTMKAMNFLPNYDETLSILDVGAGKGAQTFVLANRFKNSQVFAIDTNESYVDIINNMADEKRIRHRVQGLNMSMFNLSFTYDYFDVIWSEGSIFVQGFQSALTEWKRYLKRGGYIVCSDICWINKRPSKESQNFWANVNFEISTIENKLNIIKEAGYRELGHFIAPVTDWTTNYYVGLEYQVKRLRENFPNDPKAIAVADEFEKEIEVYNKNPNDFSYVYFIMQK